MAEGKGRSQSKPKVILTEKAEDDRLLIYLYTEQRWGYEQAIAYDEFLRDVLGILSEFPRLGAIVPGEDLTRGFIARWKGSRDGHRIFYEETPEGILVLHILHTAFDWPGRQG